MTRQERAIELRKRGYSPADIAHIIGWDVSTALRFFQDEDVQALIKYEVEDEITPTSAMANEPLTAKKELDNLEDRLSALEHSAITTMFGGIKNASLMEANKVFEAIGRRRTELAKQTGTHEGVKGEKDMGRVVVIDLNSYVAEKLKRAALQINDFNQVTEVDGRALCTMDRTAITTLIDNNKRIDSLDAIEATIIEGENA